MATVDAPATLPDVKWTPDPIFKDYRSKFYRERVPIVIDNGSYLCKAGWATESAPRLKFRSLVVRTRLKKEQYGRDVLVGNDVPSEAELLKMAFRSQFDADVVTHFDSQEHVFDHIFEHLGIDTEKVDHPILMTEAVCNPNTCRKFMSELLFECYQVPSVCYGVSPVYSYYYNRQFMPPSSDALLISSGYKTTHVLPIVEGRIYFPSTKRLKIGGHQSTKLLKDVLHVKYPLHKNALTYERVNRLKEDHTYVALDYIAELNEYKDSPTGDKTHVIQLAHPPLPQQPVLTEEERERRAKERRERGLRLAELRKKAREAEKAQSSAEGKPSPTPFPLVDIPDSELTPEQLAEKKKQKALKAAAEAKARAKERKQQQKALEEQRQQEEEARRQADPEGYVAELRAKRQNLLEKIERKQRQKEQATGRHSAAARRRMKLIAEAAIETKGVDDFGADDEDWLVYLEMANERDSDAENSDAEDETRLKELDDLLHKFDPSLAGTAAASGADTQPALLRESDYQLHLSVERIRVPEVLFQPSLVGKDCMGLSELIEFILRQFAAERQQSIVQQIFLTGGNTLYPNFKARIETDVRAIRPVDTTFRVFHAQDPIVDSWRGASLWAASENSRREFEAGSITRRLYQEMGSDYLVEHFASNKFLPIHVPQ